jgi:hypothetical protein
VHDCTGSVFSLIPPTRKGKINTKITVKAQVFYPPFISSFTEGIKWQIKIADTWRDMDYVKFVVAPTVKEYTPSFPTCPTHNRLFHIFKKQKLFDTIKDETLLQQWNHHVSVSSKSNYEQKQVVLRQGFFDKGKVLLDNDEVLYTMYLTGPCYDLFHMLPPETSFAPMMVIKPGDVIKATLLCFVYITSTGQSNTIGIAPMEHDNGNVASFVRYQS